MDLEEVWSVLYARRVMHWRPLSDWPAVAMAGTLIPSWVSTGMLERTALGNSQFAQIYHGPPIQKHEKNRYLKRKR